MSKYNFLYRDNNVGQATIDSYRVGDYLHEQTAFAASFLRGGLLTGCNVRYLFTLEIGRTLIWADSDYFKRGLYNFEVDRYYEILDIFKVGTYYQVLLSPDNIEGELEKEVVTAAQRDFIELLNRPPVSVLDTPEWRRKIQEPFGRSGKNRPHLPS